MKKQKTLNVKEIVFKRKGQPDEIWKVPELTPEQKKYALNGRGTALMYKKEKK